MILIADNKRVQLAFYPCPAGQNSPLDGLDQTDFPPQKSESD